MAEVVRTNVADFIDGLTEDVREPSSITQVDGDIRNTGINFINTLMPNSEEVAEQLGKVTGRYSVQFAGGFIKGTLSRVVESVKRPFLINNDDNDAFHSAQGSQRSLASQGSIFNLNSMR